MAPPPRMRSVRSHGHEILASAVRVMLEYTNAHAIDGGSGDPGSCASRSALTTTAWTGKGRSSRPSRPAATWCWTSARPPPSPSTIPTMRAKSARRCCATSSRPACSSAAAEWEPPSPPTRSAGSGPLPARTPRPPSRVASSSMRMSSACPRTRWTTARRSRSRSPGSARSFPGTRPMRARSPSSPSSRPGPVQERAAPRPAPSPR